MNAVRSWRGVRPWGRHSLVLVVGGLFYVGTGIADIFTELPPLREEALVVALHFVSIDIWGIIFILVGLMSILSAKWPIFAPSWGYIAMTGLAAAWGSSYLMGVLFYGAELVFLTTASSWGLVAFSWWAISGLVNPVKVIVLVVKNGSD